jgi:hypothetical protein
MAKKTRKQKQRTATRHHPGAAHPAAVPAARPAAGMVDGAGAPEIAPVATGAASFRVPTAEPAAPDSARRRVERVGPATAPGAAAGRQQRPQLRSARFGTAAAMVEPLDSDDPAIPFDRVPYVPSDLRRVAIIATAMVVLILIAWAIVTNVVD